MENKNSEERKIHYTLTKEYFKESATNKMGFYDAKGKVNFKHDKKQYQIWKICISFLNKLKKEKIKIERVIDVGCGIGDFTIDLFKMHPSLKKIVGIDFIDETIDIAKRNAKDFPQVYFKKKDLLNLDFDDNSYDLSICINVFHHIHPKDQKKAIKELSRVSSKYVILEIRNKKNIFNFWYKYIALPFFYKNLPVTSNSIVKINDMFKENNFELVSAKGIYPRIWICRRLILIYKRANII